MATNITAVFDAVREAGGVIHKSDTFCIVKIEFDPAAFADFVDAVRKMPPDGFRLTRIPGTVADDELSVSPRALEAVAKNLRLRGALTSPEVARFVGVTAQTARVALRVLVDTGEVVRVEGCRRGAQLWELAK